MRRSDLDLAGMMLKCGEHGTEVVVVALAPFPPRARPEVTISALGKEWRFAVSIVPPGAELLLPAEASHLAAGPWQSAPELSVQGEVAENSLLRRHPDRRTGGSTRDAHSGLSRTLTGIGTRPPAAIGLKHC